MVFYIEYVLIDNFVMDYIILSFVSITFSVKLKKINSILSCFVGSVLSLFIPYIMEYKILLVIYRIVTLNLIVLCIKKYKSFKSYLLYVLCYLTYTFLIGGLLIFLMNFLGVEYSMNEVMLYTFNYPIGVFVIVFILCCRLLKYVIKAIKNKSVDAKYESEIFIIDNEKIIKKRVLFDSGNNVTYCGNSVGIISIDTLLELHKEINYVDIIFHKLDKYDLKNLSEITIASLNGSKKYLSFEVDKIMVNNVEYNDVRFAISNKKFDNFDCILNYKFMGGNLL